VIKRKNAVRNRMWQSKDNSKMIARHEDERRINCGKIHPRLRAVE